MNDDLERWVNLEGPPPAGVRALLDAACSPLTPEHVARLDHKLYAALAADLRQRERRKAVKRALGGVLAVVCAALAGAVGFRLAALSDTGQMQEIAPSASRRATEQVGERVGTLAPPETSVSATAGSVDGGHGAGRRGGSGPAPPRVTRVRAPRKGPVQRLDW